MKDSCAVVSELLEKYFDHEATEEERAGFETHLHGCSACRDRLKAMEGLRHVLKAPVDEVYRKEDFYRVWQRIERGIQPDGALPWRASVERWIGAAFRKRIWIPAAAAIVALVLVLAPSVLRKSPSPYDTSVVEYVESQNYNVMVYESDKGSVTVIWLFEGPEKEGSSPS